MLRSLLFASLVTAIAPMAAHAQLDPDDEPCGRAGRPWVSIAFLGEAWTSELRKGVFDDLRAELSLSGFDGCPLGHRGSAPPLAVLELHAEVGSRVSVEIDVHDAVTQKRLVRDIDLSDVPPDGRSLSLAVATDELLRASWAELALSDAPEPGITPPPEVERTVVRSLRPELKRAPEPARVLGARFAIEHHGGGQVLLGGDATVELWLSPRILVELAVGARRGVPDETASGRVRSSALLGAVALGYALLLRPGAPGLSARVGLSAGSLSLEGEGSIPTRRALAGSSFDLHVFGMLSLTLPLWGPLELALSAGAGAPLRAVRATDSGRELSSTNGLQLRGGLGLGVAL